MMDRVTGRPVEKTDISPSSSSSGRCVSNRQAAAAAEGLKGDDTLINTVDLLIHIYQLTSEVGEVEGPLVPQPPPPPPHRVSLSVVASPPATLVVKLLAQHRPEQRQQQQHVEWVENIFGM